MILSSTSPYAILKEFSIACGFKYDAVFRVCLNNFCERLWVRVKVTFARNLAKKLSLLFYYVILLCQLLSVANPENFEEFKAREVLKTRKEKTGV